MPRAVGGRISVRSQRRAAAFVVVVLESIRSRVSTIKGEERKEGRAENLGRRNTTWRRRYRLRAYDSYETYS